MRTQGAPEDKVPIARADGWEIERVAFVVSRGSEGYLRTEARSQS
jgi:hypothetical protein